MNKCLSHIIYNAEGERVCTKMGGGFGSAPYYPIDNPLEFISGDYKEVGIGLYNMVKRSLECTRYDGSFTIKETLDPVHKMENSFEDLQYFYHPDHIGSSSFITDANGYAEQHLQYLPAGELFVSQQTSSFDTRYKFSAKEQDNETGYNFFGARYLDNDLGVWLSTDPLSDKYPEISPYMYCSGNPIIMMDPDGRENIIVIGTSANRSGEASRQNIINAAKREITSLNSGENPENTTVLIYSKLFTNNELADLKNHISSFRNVTLIESSTDTKINNYINTKSVSGEGDARSSDKITHFSYFGHGSNWLLLIAYGHSDQYAIGAGDLDKNAFSEFSSAALYSCNNLEKGGPIYSRAKSYPEYESIGEYFFELVGESLTGNIGSVEYVEDKINYSTGDPVTRRKAQPLMQKLESRGKCPPSVFDNASEILNP